MRLVRCFLIVCVISSCHVRSQNSGKAISPVHPKQILDSKAYHFAVGEKIGFAYDPESGESESVNDIALVDDYAYILDPVKKDVKEIDLGKGIIIRSSEELDLPHAIPMALCYFNNRFYVFSTNDLITELDRSLRVIRQERAAGFLGSRKKVFHLDQDSLEVRMELSWIGIVRLVIDRVNSFRFDTLRVDIRPSSKWKRVKGKTYEEITPHNGRFLKTEIGEFELRTALPDCELYLCESFDFSHKWIVSFRIDEKSMEILVNRYQ